MAESEKEPTHIPADPRWEPITKGDVIDMLDVIAHQKDVPNTLYFVVVMLRDSMRKAWGIEK